MIDIHVGDCYKLLGKLPLKSAQCIVTSPPYWQQRKYSESNASEIGREISVGYYVRNMVKVFNEAWHVLRDDGVLWLNLGDKYMDKELCGLPWRVAFALQDSGWLLRRDIIWHKLNPMTEPVQDRCTTAHEYVFMFTKEAHYYYDGAAIQEPFEGPQVTTAANDSGEYSAAAGRNDQGQHKAGGFPVKEGQLGRNKRSVWSMAGESYHGAHFATMPTQLADTCIRASTRPGDLVLDPFGGAGTTALVADRLDRSAVLIELSEEYAHLARLRLFDDAGMFAQVGFHNEHKL